MANYGRNFGFRIEPRGQARNGRFVVSTTALAGSGTGGGAAGSGRLVIGAPVVFDGSAGLDAQNRQYVKLATEAEVDAGFDVATNSTSAIPGMAGIVVYEYGPAAFAGDDPYLTTYSDKGDIPLGSAVQVISGDPTVKVVLRNTVAHTFLTVRPYPARTMVNGLGATPTVAVGDFLVPGKGDDVNGYWESTATEEGAWMVITSVDTTRLEVEARMLF